MHSEFQCFACGTKTRHDPSKRHLPYGWNFIKIEGKPRTLCKGCGFGLGPGTDYSMDDDALSPDLRDLIKDKL